jgi:uncharacterized protein YwbE
MRMQVRHVRSLAYVPLDSIVCLKVDKDTGGTKSTRGLLCIILEEQSNHVQGIRVATQWGVVAGHLKGTKRYYQQAKALRCGNSFGCGKKGVSCDHNVCKCKGDYGNHQLLAGIADQPQMTRDNFTLSPYITYLE